MTLVGVKAHLFSKLPKTLFDSLQLAAVLREVKYLEKRHSEEIPETAAKLYERHQEFWSYLNSLDVTVKWYNHVRQTTLEVCGCYIVAMYASQSGV